MTPKQWLAREFLIDNFEELVSVLAQDRFLRRALEAKVSCHMLQHGSHIDSLPIETNYILGQPNTSLTEV